MEFQKINNRLSTHLAVALDFALHTFYFIHCMWKRRSRSAELITYKQTNKNKVKSFSSRTLKLISVWIVVLRLVVKWVSFYFHVAVGVFVYFSPGDLIVHSGCASVWPLVLCFLWFLCLFVFFYFCFGGRSEVGFIFALEVEGQWNH